MKKTLSFLLVFALVFSFAGCTVSNENETEIYFSIDAYTMSGAMLKVTCSDGSVEETGSYGFAGKEGMTIKEVLAEAGIEKIEPYLEGDIFEGWIIFENVYDDDGVCTFELRSDEVCTTEEIFKMNIPEYEATFVAKWASMSVEDYYADEDYMWEDGVTTGAIALSADGGLMTFAGSDGTEYENGVYTYWMEDGTSLNDITAGEEWDALVSVEKDGAEFAGWSVYEADSITWGSEEVNDDTTLSFVFDVYEGFEYILLENGKEYDADMTTEELCSLVNESKHYFAVANWK